MAVSDEQSRHNKPKQTLRGRHEMTVAQDRLTDRQSCGRADT